MPRRAPEREDVEDLVDQAKKLTGDPKFRLGLAVGAAVTVAIGVFIFQNGESTDLQFLWADFNIPLWVGLLASFAAGCLAAPLFAWSWRRHRRLKRERKDAERQIREAEKDLAR